MSESKLSHIESQILDLARNYDQSSRNLTDVRAELRELRDLIISTKTSVERGDNPEAKALPAKVEKVVESVQNLEKKFPPLPAIYAGLVIAVGLLGAGYFDLKKMREPIDTTVLELKKSAAVVGGASKALEAATESFSAQEKLIAAETKALSRSFEESTKQLEGFEKTMKMVLTDLNALESRFQNAKSTVSNKSANDRKKDSGSELLYQVAQRQGMPVITLFFESVKAHNEGKYEDAISLANQAKAIDPDSKDGRYDNMIGRCYQRLGRFDDAIAAYEGGIERSPEDSALLNNLGTLHFTLAQKSKDQTEKIRHLEKCAECQMKAFEHGPDETTAVNASAILNSLGRYKESLELLEKYQGTKGVSFDEHHAATLAKMGRKVEALATLKKMFQAEPSSAVEAAADDDFESMRDDPAFRILIKEAVGDNMFNAIQKAWQAVGSKRPIKEASGETGQSKPTLAPVLKDKKK